MTGRRIPRRKLRDGGAAVQPVPQPEPPEPRTDVDRHTVAQILDLPIDGALASDLDAAEEPVADPWKAP